MAFKMKNPSMAKMVKAAGDNRAAMKMKMEKKAAAAKMKKEAAMKMKKESAMKMEKESMAKLKEKASAMKMKKSPMEKELVGNQKNLNEGLKKAIEAAPSKMKKSAMKMKKSAMEMKEPMKMKKDSAMKQKMNMVKGPDGKMVPDFAVDGKGAGDMKKSATKMRNRKGAMETESPMKKDGTKFTDKVKAAGRALKDNLFKAHEHGNVHNTLTANTNRSYKKYKKQYREAAKKEAPAKMKKAAMKMSHKK